MMYGWSTKDIEWILMQLDRQKLPFKKYRFSSLGKGMNLLGGGGYSKVYEARTRAIPNNKFAIKVIGFNDRNVDSKAFREAVQGQKRASFLQKNIVKVYDFTELRVWLDDNNNVTKVEKIQKRELEIPEGNYLTLRFVVMEKLIPVLSENWGKSFKLMPKKLASFDEKEILKLAYDIGTALKEVHNAKLLHRDIKLENVFYSPRKRCYKLGDFGIAKNTEDGIASTIAYTKGYGAPEVISTSYANYDNTADIYSLGMLLYVLLNGMRFPESDTYVTNFNVQYEKGYELTKPEYGSAKIFSVIEQMCRFDPDDRYQSMEEVLDALDVVRIGETIGVKKQSENYVLAVGTIFLCIGAATLKLICFPDFFIGFTPWWYILLGLLIIRVAMNFVKLDISLFSLVIFGVGIYAVFESGFDLWKILIVFLLAFSKGIFAGIASLTALVINGVSIVMIYNEQSWEISDEYKWLAVLLLSMAFVLLYEYFTLNSDDYKLKNMLFRKNIYWILVSVLYSCCAVYGIALNYDLSTFGERLRSCLEYVVGSNGIRFLTTLDLFKIGVFGLVFCVIWNITEKVMTLANARDVDKLRKM